MYPCNGLLPMGAPMNNPQAPNQHVNQYRPELEKQRASQQAINPGFLMTQNIVNPHRK